MSGSALPVFPLLAVYGVAAGLAIFITRPSSGLRAVVLILIIGVAMLVGISFTVTSILGRVATEASWYYDQ